MEHRHQQNVTVYRDPLDADAGTAGGDEGWLNCCLARSAVGRLYSKKWDGLIMCSALSAEQKQQERDMQKTGRGKQ